MVPTFETGMSPAAVEKRGDETMRIPKCDAAGRHSWKPVNGCKENAGYCGIGGAAVSYTEECRNCGMRRTKVFGDVERYGNRNHGFRYAGAL